MVTVMPEVIEITRPAWPPSIIVLAALSPRRVRLSVIVSRSKYGLSAPAIAIVSPGAAAPIAAPIVLNQPLPPPCLTHSVVAASVAGAARLAELTQNARIAASRHKWRMDIASPRSAVLSRLSGWSRPVECQIEL